ncbi:MAG: SAM-dependent methyltransferase, partial [Deltaproteobacteria bacterium]|nr:SAM-dependent methyltransferase [Deltaproteobacteria bacterium]
LSLKYGLQPQSGEKDLPEQKSIFLDAGRLGPITRFTGDLNALEHLDFTTMALPYHIRKPERVLVVGGGGGMDVLLSLRYETPGITVLETNQQILDLMLGPFAEFSGHLYLRPEVDLVAREARQFLHGTNGRYDLISLSLLDSPGTSAGGLHSAAEDYLYTVEAFKEYLSHLTDRGMVSITRWLKLPPRDSLRVTATALKALSSTGFSQAPEKHLLFIRSWKTTTILLSRQPFTPEDITQAIAFCKERNFDLVFYAGMKSSEANRYDVQDFPFYHEAAKSLIGPNAKAFLSDYAFDVSPTTDDRPYFSHFFRWDKAPELYKQLQREWLPMVELGYVFIIATLVQAALASGVLILVPLLFLRWVRRRDGDKRAKPKDILYTLIYFGFIGLAFMLLEMALLPQYTLLLSHPVYSAAVVLGSLLVFAGSGSMCVGVFQSKGSGFLWISVLFIVLWVGFHGIAGGPLFGWALARPMWVRLVLSIGMLSILAFFLGWPFPWGLRAVAKSFPGLVPWAWGVNACASVVGAVLGKFLAISLGFRNVMFMACLLYVIALFLFQKWSRSQTR